MVGSEACPTPDNALDERNLPDLHDLLIHHSWQPAVTSPKGWQRGYYIDSAIIVGCTNLLSYFGRQCNLV
jgi:hypothetical protein